MTRRWGWPPQVINEFTPYQGAIYLGALSPEHGDVLKMSIEEVREVFGPVRFTF